MSNYLRDVLGADNSSSEFAQPQGLVADVGPDIPGGEGANKGAWRDQLRDRLGQFAKMFGLVLFDIEIEGIGRVTGHGELIDIVRPGVGLVRVKNHKVLGDIDMEMLGEQLEAIDAIIPDADYERVTGKDVTPNTKPTPELKDSISGDEALQKIYGQMGLHAKKSGRFAVGRSVKDVRDAAKETYKPVYEKLKDEYPELMTEFPDYESYWNYASNSLAAGVFTRWADSVDDIPELTKASNKIYAREILGLKEDGIIEFYRNSVNHKSSPELAGAGYASLDRRMAWDYNSYLIKYADNGLNENDGRYIVKAKPDEVTGLLGLSGAEDEYGVVIGLDVTSQPGRTTRVGDLEMQQVAPWSNDIQTFDRSGGGSPFRRVSPASQFEVFATENPLPGNGYGDFYEAFGLDKESRPIPTKWDEMFGEGSFDALNGDYPSFRSMQSLFVDAGDGKVGLDMMQLDQISSRDSQNPEANDTYDKTLKMLSVIQELSGKTFMVHRGHNPDDPRLDEVKDEEPVVEKTPEPELEKPWLNVQYSDEEEEETELTEEEIEKLALENYSVNLYKYINQYLREGREGIVDSDTFTSNPFYVDQIVQSAESIKKAFNKESNVLPEDTTLSRLVPRFVGENLKPGDTLEDAAILSTTKNPKESGTKNMFHRSVINKLRGSYGETYGESEPTKVGWTVYEIEAPKGTKAIDMDTIGELDEEGEILLPPNTKLEVVSVEDRPEPDFPQADDSIFKAYTVKLRVVPDTAEVAEQEPTNKKSEPSLNFSDFEKVSGPLGSNPGGVYKDPKTGEQYYAKIQDEDRGNNERLASAIYKEAGLGSLEVKDGTLDGKPITYTEWKEGLTPLFGPKANDLGYSKRQEALDSAKDGYLIDAWIANWDIVGEGLDNISTDEDSNPIRLDAGGALLYRARGSRKGSAFGNEVVELETFKDSSNTAELMYGNMYLFPRAERNSYEKLKAISPDRIDQLVDQYISNPDDNKELKDKLKARRQFILDKYENSYLLTGSESKLYGSKTTQNISKEDKKAVNNYTNAGHRYINKYLRDPKNPEYQKSKESAEKLNNIIKDNTLIEDTTLLRVTGNFDEDYQPGDIIEDAGIQSTTKVGRSAIHSTVMDKLYPGDPEAAEFLGYTTYTIKAPAGTPALDVTDMSQFRSEGEVLLPAGTKFKVISYERKPVSEFGGSYRNITVEVVSGEDSEKTDTNEPFDSAESAEEEQPISTAKMLDSLVKDGIVDLDAVPDSTILSKFTVDDIPEDQRRSLSTYSSSDYQVINNLLRFGPESAYTPTKDINKLVKNLDDLIESKGTVESDSVVFRGMIETERYEDSDVLMSEMLDGLKPGDVISDPAFLSTSSDKNVALRKFGPGNMTDEDSKLDASNPVYQSSSFWVIKVPEGSKAFATPEKGFGYASVEKEVILPRNTQLRIDGIKKVAQEEEGGENGEFNYYIEASVVPISKNADWDPLTGLETFTEKKERIEPGFENWNKEVEKIFEDWDNDLIVGVEIYDAGNILQANFIQKAGFNEKPKVLSQEEFDAIEAETVYRGHQSIAFMNNYKDSELQFAGEGYFGNGTYTSNKRDTAENYAGSSGPDPSTQAEIDERILEMKMLPDANVLSFEEVTDLREWADQKTREFLESYEKFGANPAQYQEAEWRLFNEADYTNIAIMLGIDAIRFKVPLTDAEEYYTIILNRGKVAINGKS